MTDRREILDTAASLIGGERQQDYGSAADNFARIGNLWAEVLGVPVTAVQVALCMNQVKVARLVSSPDHLDSWVDGAGYLAIGGEIATDGAANAFRELRVPRVVESLGFGERTTKWVDAEGSRYEWDANNHCWDRIERPTSYVSAVIPDLGTYTEVIE